MKKKILIVAGSLHIGGIERSLANLFNCLDYSKYDVDLFLYSNTGEYLHEIPQSVNLVNKSWLLNCIGLSKKEVLDTKNITAILVRGISAVVCKIIGSNNFFEFLFKLLPGLKGYDVAISYVHNVHPKTVYFGYNKYVLNNVRANRKIAWIHSDYIKAGFNYPSNNDEYRQFDAIINISQECKAIFDNTLPDLAQKSFVVYNTYPIEKIREAAVMCGNPYDETKLIKIVSVGRIDSNKSFDRILRVAEKLISEGLNFKWYIVGSGNEENILKEMCFKMNLQNYVFFLGAKKNPYPYIKYADVFVLTSKYEGMPMVISESLILGIPVVTTKYASANEQVIDGINGIIVNNSEAGIYNCLRKLLVDKYYLINLKNNIINSEFSNYKALSQFEHVINK